MNARILALVSSLTLTHALMANLPAPYNQITLRPYDGQGFFGKGNRTKLTELIKTHRPNTIVEVGVWLGTSAIFMAELLAQRKDTKPVLYAIDHFKGSAEHLNPAHQHHNKVNYLYEQFLSNVIHKKLTHIITPVPMASLDAAKALDVAPDLVYIDGSHEEADVTDDIRTWYQKLAPKGIMCGDDWNWGSQRGYPVRRAVQKMAQELGRTIKTNDNFWYFV